VLIAGAIGYRLRNNPGEPDPAGESVAGLFEMLQRGENEAALAQEELERRIGVKDRRPWDKALRSPQARARSLAVESLGQNRSPETVGILIDALEDPASSVRLCAVQALSIQDPKLALRPMLAAIKDDDTWVSEAASQKIRELKRPEAVPDLIGALHSPDRETGVFALSALKHLTKQPFHAGKVDSQQRWDSVARQWETWWSRSRAKWPTNPDATNVPPIHPAKTLAAPSFALRAYDGTDLSLDKLRGKVVLLNFWGMLCGPCMAEMPGLDRIATRYKGRGLIVIGAETNAPDITTLRRYADMYHISYPLAPAPAAMRDAYGHIHDVPVSFLIDREGRIRYQWDGDREERVFDAAIRRVLGG
jgi:peroxiredoxin